ncbi:hypothetical protein J6590_010821 [Homalodisca vitripennis]|nr:hypothetical protein J6590_010821 [Homalodisca vitripennis]
MNISDNGVASDARLGAHRTPPKIRVPSAISAGFGEGAAEARADVNERKTSLEISSTVKCLKVEKDKGGSFRVHYSIVGVA